MATTKMTKAAHAQPGTAMGTTSVRVHARWAASAQVTEADLQSLCPDRGDVVKRARPIPAQRRKAVRQLPYSRHGSYTPTSARACELFEGNAGNQGGHDDRQ